MNSTSFTFKSEQDIIETFENNQKEIKSYQKTHEDCRNFLKKISQSTLAFSKCLDDITTNFPSEANNQLQQMTLSIQIFVKKVAGLMQNLSSSVMGSASSLKDNEVKIKDWRNACKQSYEDQVKIISRVTKDYEQSEKIKIDAQIKLREYERCISPIEKQKSQQYNTLQNALMFAEQDLLSRTQIRQSCQVQFQGFLQEQLKQTRALFEKQNIIVYSQFSETMNSFIETMIKINEIYSNSIERLLNQQQISKITKNSSRSNYHQNEKSSENRKSRTPIRSISNSKCSAIESKIYSTFKNNSSGLNNVRSDDKKSAKSLILLSREQPFYGQNLSHKSSINSNQRYNH